MPPRPYDMLNLGLKDELKKDEVIAKQNIREEKIIYKETQVFKEENINSIILMVSDNAVEPYYHLGDYIGGVRVFNNEIKKFTGQFCILELESNLILPRLLQLGSRNGVYNICSTNPKTKSSPLNLYDVRVIGAAPILWHRRKIASFF